MELLEPYYPPSGRKDLFPAIKDRKPANKPGKGKKLPNRHPEITKIIAESAVSKDEFLFYYEKLLHQVFRTAAVIPSIKRGLINKDGITFSGDGTHRFSLADSREDLLEKYSELIEKDFCC